MIFRTCTVGSRVPLKMVTVQISLKPVLYFLQQVSNNSEKIFSTCTIVLLTFVQNINLVMLSFKKVN